MKRIFIWYLPQAALFVAGFCFAATVQPPATGIAMVLFGVLLAAAYTGAVNLLMDLWSRLKRKPSKTSSEGLRLAGTRRGLGQPAEGRERIGVRE